MANRNQTVRWVESQPEKFIIEHRIMDYQKQVRGIYGIFVIAEGKERCVYVGRSDNIYARMFKGRGHLVRLMKNCHSSKQLTVALRNIEEKIHIRVLKEIALEGDDYYKDMQRLASAECYFIDFYQKEEGNFLEQVPEGTQMTVEKWRKRIGAGITNTD